jgi:hypothetical protein
MFGGLIPHPHSKVGTTNNMPPKGDSPSYMGDFNPSYMTGMFKRFEEGGKVDDSLLEDVQDMYFKKGGMPKYAHGGYHLGQNRSGFGFNQGTSFAGGTTPQPSYTAPLNPTTGIGFPQAPGSLNYTPFQGQSGFGFQSGANFGRNAGTGFAGGSPVQATDGSTYTTPSVASSGDEPEKKWSEMTGKEKWERIKEHGEEGLPYMSSLYNLGMGLFGQVEPFEEIRNPYEGKALDLMGGRRFEAGPQYEANRRMFNAMRRQARNLGQSPGAFYNRLSSSAYDKRMQDLKIGQLEDRLNNQYKGEEARMLANLGQGRVGAQERARAMTTAAEQNLAQYLPKAVEDVSKIAQAKSRDKMRMGLAEGMFSNMKYNKRTKKWEYDPSSYTKQKDIDI